MTDNLTASIAFPAEQLRTAFRLAIQRGHGAVREGNNEDVNAAASLAQFLFDSDANNVFNHHHHGQLIALREAARAYYHD